MYNILYFYMLQVVVPALNNEPSLFSCCAADVTEVTGREQTEGQPAKKGRGRKQ